MDAGYTLVEMLVALAIIGLTIGGLAEGAHVLRLVEGQDARSIVRERAYLRAQAGLTSVLNGAGPFRSDDEVGLQGAASEFDFSCGVAQCGARLVSGAEASSLILSEPDGSERTLKLEGIKDPTFSYYDDAGALAGWPPSKDRGILRSIAILAGPGQVPVPVAMTRIRIEQKPDCEFDPITRDCRGTQQ